MTALSPGALTMELVLHWKSKPARSHRQVLKTIKILKTGKPSGIDSILPEAIQALGGVSVTYIHVLLDKIWKNEHLPNERRKGLLVQIPQKGVKSQSNSWRSITCTLLRTILCSIIIENTKHETDKLLGETQADFRWERSFIDHIATLRIIFEQSVDWQIFLYLNFLTSKKLSTA